MCVCVLGKDSKTQLGLLTKHELVNTLKAFDMSFFLFLSKPMSHLLLEKSNNKNYQVSSLPLEDETV